MLKKINNIKQNTYVMQIATLMSGALMAQIVTFAFIPIITRLYTPTEFGLYSLFFSIVSILGLISSLKYDQAIMLPKSDKDAQALVFLSILITCGMVIVTIFILAIFYDFFIEYFDENEIFIWMIPFGVALLGILQIFNAYSSRKQFYKKLATVKVINSFTVVGVQSLSKYIFKYNGLVLGKLLADTLSLFLLLKFHFKRNTLQLKSLTKRRIKLNAKRHDHFPKYQSFTVFLNSISQNIPIMLLASLYSPEIAGYYALTVRVLQVPIGLIGSSTKEVYYQKASKMYANRENIFELYKKTTVTLLKLFIVPFFIVLLFGGHLFSFVFGEEWIESGKIAQILILWFLFLFINSPSMITFSILKLQKVQMKMEIISLIMRFLSIYIGYYFFNSYILSISLFLLISVSVNIYAISYIYMTLQKRLQK